MMVCGVDPSRSGFAVSFVEGLEEINYREYRNTMVGYETFMEDLNECEEIPKVCIEGYGDFARQLVLYLKSKGVSVYEVNPRMSRQLKDSISIHKTDHIDAYTCAVSYMIRRQEELEVDGALEGLKNLTRLYSKISRATVSFKNQMKSALNQGLGWIYKDVFEELNILSLTFYSQYGSIREIKESSEEDLHKTMCMAGSCRYKGLHGQKKAAKIKELVKDIDTSITSSFTEIQSSVIKGYALTLITMIEQKEKIKKQIEEYINKEYPDYKEYLEEMRGVTALNMAVIISEGGLTRTFKDEGHFASYCGQAPRQYQSTSMKKFISSPNYNRYMANTIHFMACQNVLKNGMFYEDYIEAKKHYSRKLRALKKIKRHLCRILFYKLMTYRLHLISVKNIKSKQVKACVA